jgi:RNA polymerase sigma-70 factor (ECF subfamily)
MNDPQSVAFRRRHRRLMDTARSLLGTPAEAEDVVQEAYLRSHQASKQPVESPDAWLLTVVRHLAVDRLRRRRLEREWLQADLAAASDAGTPSAEQVAALNAQCETALWQLARRLTPLEAAVLLLRELFELDYAEIARSAGKSEAACRQVVHRALLRVRDRRPAARQGEDVEWLWAMCRQAWLTQSPAVLHTLLKSAAPVGASAAGSPMPARTGAPRSRVGLAQVAGRFAVVLELDGQFLCSLPVGPIGDPAQEGDIVAVC